MNYFSRRIELLEGEMRTELSKTVGFGDDALGKILTNLTMSIILPIVRRALFEPPPGWHTFGTHVDTSTLLEFSNITDETGLPLWERPAE